MVKEHTYLTFFLSSGFDLGLAMSWSVITLKDIEEQGGFILIQVETDQAADLFEEYEHRYCTSFKSFPFRSQIIYFDPLYNKAAEIKDRIHKDLKKIQVNRMADRFQM
jgi:hypothetical protein